jgi:hypothetical protein
MQRGASVLAALVVAAALASIAMLVQQGSPVALSQRSQAADAATPASQVVSQTEQQCVSGFDYKVGQTPSEYQVVGTAVCPEGAAASGTADKRCTKKNPNGTWAKQDGWKCKETYCFNAPADTSKVKKGQELCSTSESDLGEKSFNLVETKASAVNSAIEQGQLSPTNLKDVGLTDAEKSALSDAFSNKGDDLLQKAGQLNDDYAQLQSDYDKKLQEMGGVAAGSACSAGSGDSTLDCSGLQAIADAKQAKADQLAKITAEYDNLNKAQSALDASDGKPDSSEGAGVANPCTDPGSEGCFCSKNPSRCSGPGRINNPNNTFNNPNNNPSGNNPSGGNPLGGLGKGMGGGRGSGGGSGSGQQQQQQQQCQPQYQCSNNTVMYSQCPQQNSQWQSVQQCPTGYTCSGNSCQAQAPYGYCTNGQPRTAPAQAQPAASSCSAGTWQDSSNGCQQSWQCSTGSTTGAPTAQLSCQPLTAASGMTITLAYVCSGGSTKVAATGFTATETELASTTKTIIQKPTDGTNSVTYAVTCTNANASPVTTASAQCSVSVGNAAIVLVATPEKIAKTETEDLKRKSTIGWVTSGMQSCVISNTDFADWTTAQAGNTSISGAAVSPIITTDTTFKLTCQTLGGAIASSTVKVLSI